jgi:hypothetical protein
MNIDRKTFLVGWWAWDQTKRCWTKGSVQAKLKLALARWCCEALLK